MNWNSFLFGVMIGDATTILSYIAGRCLGAWRNQKQDGEVL